MRHRHCKMKGFLSFLILWLIKKKNMTGSEITEELEQRKGSRPSPGTIYPVLKDLKKRGLLSNDEKKRYTLTKQGEEELALHLKSFFNTFCDIEEMKTHCQCHKE